MPCRLADLGGLVLRPLALTLALAVITGPAVGARAEPTPAPQPPFSGLDQTDRPKTVRFRHLRRRDTLFPVNVNGWWGLVAKDADLVVFPAFEWIDVPHDKLVRAVQDGKTGFLDRSGHWQIDPVYPFADRFEEGYAVVGDGQGRFAFINKAGNALTRKTFDGALRFREGVAAVLEDGRVGFIDKRGRYTIEPRFIRARSFHDGRAVAQLPDASGEPGPIGFINRAGKFLFLDRSGRVTDLRDFNQNLAAAKGSGGQDPPRWGYLDKTYRMRIEPRFVETRDFTRGLAAVAVPGPEGRPHWGYINKLGDWQIEPRFEWADDFDDTLAMVRHQGRYGFVDKTGTFRVQPRFKHAEPFRRGFARVAIEPNFGYIDRSGRLVWHPRWLIERPILSARRDTRHHPTHASSHHPGDQRLPTPPPRPYPGAGYPPEHRYEEVIPPIPPRHPP